MIVKKLDIIGRASRTLKYCLKHRLRPIPTSCIHVSYKYKFIYFPICKVASRACAQSIHDLHGYSNNPNIKNKERVHVRCIDYFLRLPKHQYDDYHKWVFVRNPWDRLYSCYLNKIYDIIDIFNCPPFPAVYMGWVEDSFKLNPMTFEAFVKLVGKTPDFLCDGHFLPQHYFFNLQEMDFIGRFENFEADMLKVLNIVAPGYGIKKFERRNQSSSRGGKAYREHYTDEMREIVARKYARDIELFDYQF